MTLMDLGARESNFNLTVTWPLYFAYKQRAADREREKQEGRGR